MNIGSSEWKLLLKEGAKTMGGDIDPEKIDQLALHAVELVKWNQKINLTAITDPLEIAIKHFLDSMKPVPMIPLDASVIDIGSGGGFPGMVLKVLIPSLSVTLIDASRKKVSFLKHVIRTLGLTNIEARQERVEDLGEDKEFMKKFDIAISRAFSKIDIFVRAALPLLSSTGIILAMKGRNIQEEMQRLDQLRSDRLSSPFQAETLHVQLTEYTLPYLDSKRSIITVGVGRQQF